jgi:hypothetical protein
MRRRTSRPEGHAFVCGVNGCTKSYPTENGRAQHFMAGHGIKGRRRCMKLSDNENASHLERIYALRSQVHRGKNMDCAGLWDRIIEAGYGRRRGA